jgi:hypothetical protein
MESMNSEQGMHTIVAVAHVHAHDDGVTLQIELQNGCAVTLTQNGDRASTAIWTASGEHGFELDTVESFVEWLKRATGYEPERERK